MDCKNRHCNHKQAEDQHIVDNDAKEKKHNVMHDEKESPAANIPKDELATLKETLLRTLAENENLHKRFAKEKEDLLRYSSNKFAFDMLTISDNIGRAISNIDEKTDTKKIRNGLLIVQKELLSIFKKNNIEKVELKIGDKFDPARHQAVVEEENHAMENGAVSKIMQDGYLLHDRLLRPAMVAVIKSN